MLIRYVKKKSANAFHARHAENRIREPLKMSELPAQAWKEVSIDFTKILNGQYLLVAYDDYSRYPVVSKVTTTSAKAVISKLEEMFSIFGIPEVVKSDNGPPFL